MLFHECPENMFLFQPSHQIFDADGNKVGEVTSGVFGPSVKGPVAMGYVEKKHSKSGTKLQVG